MSLKEKAYQSGVDLIAEASKQDEAKKLEAKREEARLDEVFKKDIEEAPSYILETFGVTAIPTGKTTYGDRSNPPGVWFDLIDSDGQPIADKYSGRYVEDEAIKAQLSRALYVTEGKESPLLLMSVYEPETGTFTANGGGYNAIDLWNTVNTIMVQRWGQSQRQITDEITVPRLEAQK